jgi:hypothetical protein
MFDWARRRSSIGREGASVVNLDPRWECNVMAADILRRIRERSYQIWEQEGRPAGRHLDHWLRAEQELVAINAVEFEFKQLMRAFRSGIISETTVEQVMTDLEKRALSDGMRCSRRLGDLLD